MSKIIKISIIALTLLMTMSIIIYAQEQDYAHWGKTALEEVKKQYPNSQVSDYEYLGRNIIANNEVQDSFDFVIKKGFTKKLVRAYVSFNPQNNQLISIRIKEIQL